MYLFSEANLETLHDDAYSTRPAVPWAVDWIFDEVKTGWIPDLAGRCDTRLATALRDSIGKHIADLSRHLQSSNTKEGLRQSRRDETIECGSFSADRSLLWVSATQHGKVDKPRLSYKRLGMPHHRPDPRFQAPGPRPFDDEAGKRPTPSPPSWRAGLDHPLFVMRRRLSFYKTLCSSPHPG